MPLAPRRPLASSATRKRKPGSPSRPARRFVSRPLTTRPAPAASTHALRPFQVEDVAFIKKHDYRVLVANAPGTGKAQPLNAKVLTPTGWTTVGTLRVGDKVIDPDGGDAEVLGVFPQGVKKVYRVSVAGGGSTECCEEHLWTVQTNRDRRTHSTRTMSLADLCASGLERLATEKNPWASSKYFLPNAASMDFAPVDGSDLPLDPYLLGVIIGDGSVSEAGNSVGITSADEDIVESVRRALPLGVALKEHTGSKYGWRISRESASQRNTVRAALERLGVFGKRAEGKSVPSAYLFASRDARLALLRGLMDTDGDCGKGYATFNSSSEQLAADVAFLVGSLGGFTTTTSRFPTYSYKGEKLTGRKAYRVRIRLEVCPFALARKVGGWRPSLIARGIKAVEYVRDAECACIAVSTKRNLYITDNFIVTHNTPTSLSCVAGDREKLTPTLVVCPASVVTNWCREARKWVPGAVIHAVTDLSSKMPTRKVDVFVVSWALLAERYLDLAAVKPRFLIADECHYVKGGEETLRGQAFSILARRAPHMILLSGTPLVNRPAELETIKSLFGTQNVPMIRRHLEDVLPEIPPKSRSMLRVRMRPKDEADYRKAQKEFAEWLEVELARRLTVGDVRAAAERTLAAEALTKAGYLRRLVGLAKVPAAIDWISKAVRVGEPVVVFCEHQEVVSRLQRFLTKQRIRHVTIDGGTGRKQRQAAIDAFQAGLVPVFIGTKAAKEGITLTRGRNLLFVERYFTSADEEQAEDRIRRFGQAHPTTVWFLHANDTLDDRLQEIIDTKRKIVAEHLGSVHIEETEEAAVLELISAWHENAARHHQPKAEATDLGLGKPLPPLPSASEVLRVSFKPSRWAEGTARAWATMHGYKTTSVVVKEGVVRVNSVPLDRFVPGEFRTVQISADISAVVGERKLLPRKKAPAKTASKGLKKPSPQGGVPVRSTQRDFRRSPLLRRRG